MRSELNRVMDLFDEMGLPYEVEDDPDPHPNEPGRFRLKILTHPRVPVAAIVFTATGEYEEVGVWGWPT